jgi:hypothetical protein
MSPAPNDWREYAAAYTHESIERIRRRLDNAGYKWRDDYREYRKEGQKTVRFYLRPGLPNPDEIPRGVKPYRVRVRADGEEKEEVHSARRPDLAARAYKSDLRWRGHENIEILEVEPC